MLGRTHVLSGAVAFNALTLLGPWAHLGLAARGVMTVLAAGAAALCDLDQCGSTAARTFGLVSELFAEAVHVGTGGHREGTHSVLGDTVMTGIAAGCVAVLTVDAHPATGIGKAGIAVAGVVLAVLLAFIFASAADALHIMRHHTAEGFALAAALGIVLGHGRIPGMYGIPVAVAVGVTAHILGDMLTTHGCPLGWPFTQRCFHLTPRFLRFTTGTWPEHVIAVGLTAALFWFGWSLTGLAAYIQH